MLELQSKEQYFNIINPKYITWEFYKKYIDVEPNFGTLGLIVFLRTYSRYIPQLKRREKWCETLLRVVEYNVGLDKTSSFSFLKQEAEQLFDDMFNLKTFVSGRSLWIGGTKITDRHGSAIFNCTYANIDSISSFTELYYELLLGAGTGFSVEEHHLKKLPEFYKNIKITHKDYVNLSYKKREHTILSSLQGDLKFDITDLTENDGTYKEKIQTIINYEGAPYYLTLKIGDSKEGWVNAVRILLTLFTIPNKNIEVNIVYDCIRPEGSRLKQFGGRASGHKALKTCIEKIEKWIKRNQGNHLSSVTATDIMTTLAEGVVVGGTRRAALLSLGDVDDEAFITMKKNLWSDESKSEYRNNRVLSNNSVALYGNPTKEQLKNIVESIKTNGEPGFVCLGNNQKLRPNVEGVNPCAEINLQNKQCCNLTTLNLNSFIEQNSVSKTNYLDFAKLQKSTQAIVRAGSRATLVNQWHPEWDKKQKEDRLLGQSMTGIMDAFNQLEEAENEKWIEQFYRHQRNLVRDTADKYHDSMGIEHSASVTTIKPEGSISQLPTVSSGIHQPYAPFYQRNVRFSNQDPLSQALKDMGVKVSPENNQGNVPPKNLWQKILKMFGKFNPSNEEKLMADDCNTWIFSFPIKTNAKIRQIDESAISQLERYKSAQQNYIESHNVSITVNVGENEWNDIVDWVYNNYDLIGNISLLPKFDPDTVPYPNLPYLPINEQEYNKLYKQCPILEEEQLIEKIMEYENDEFQEEYEILDSACSGGSCPVR